MVGGEARTNRFDRGGRKVPSMHRRSASYSRLDGSGFIQLIYFEAFGGGKPQLLPTCHSGYS